MCFDDRETRRRVHQRIVALKPACIEVAGDGWRDKIPLSNWQGRVVGAVRTLD